MAYTTPPGKPVPVDNPDKNDSEHPAIAGQYWQRQYVTTRSGVAEVDYDTEPYRVARANSVGAAKAVPPDDFETATQAQRRTQERSDAGVMQ